MNRLINETQELQHKINKLKCFLTLEDYSCDLSKEEYSLLEIQLQAMQAYHLCLTRRLTLLSNNKSSCNEYECEDCDANSIWS